MRRRRIISALGGLAVGLGAGIAWERSRHGYGRSEPRISTTRPRRSGSELFSVTRSPEPEKALEIEKETMHEAMQTAEAMAKGGRVIHLPTWEDDGTVTQRVRTRLGEDKRTARMPRLNVDVCNGVCTIHGHVNSEREFDDIQAVAAETDGVQKVHLHVGIGSRYLGHEAM